MACVADDGGLRRRARRLGLLAVALTVVAGACGKKGPPMPPLVRLPAAPTAIKAERRGAAVDVQLVVPVQNTDGSRPANVQRVEVYAWDGPPEATPADVVRRGTRVGFVEVKAPRDPNQAIRAGDPLSDAEPLEGPGLDQGATAHVRETLTAAPDARTVQEAAVLLPDALRRRAYAGVAITTRGRRGPISELSVIPLGPAPEAPRDPALTYDEAGVTVGWAQAPASDDAGLLDASSPAGEPRPAYHVYDVSTTAQPPHPANAAAAHTPAEVRLTTAAIADTTFVDRRVKWDEERCYVVRAVRRVDALVVEGDPTARTCITPVDTFAPAPPTGLTTVASSGAISLIWNPSPERDLAGYYVMRSDTADAPLRRLTPSTIVETTYTDQVSEGRRFFYAVQAVDKAGNASEPSTRVEEAAQEAAQQVR